ncbi:SusD-like starch-binding protein associating with outer membrane [Maribacter spongiicola]|uniref:SusD-like starch-binding protein associating with outer membrane n=1 Tax=Maribacter spongiicola TaxID=1206753 RepID=A0A4V3EPP8_9FLAO|nr:RagB/SusD family nutrient uptake outer membrane protein [Maribacter spongiicola]TDT38748.1 SusD-like starch-binding protein associating with outer membrane [Maribacter spongiicola]
MKHIKFLVFAITGSVFLSCSDEFLSPLPETAIAVESFFQTDADVLSGIYGIYDGLQGVNENTEGNEANANRGVQLEHLLTEHRSDNTRTQTLEGSKADFHRYVVDATNVESEDYYQSMYEVIFRVNNILDYIDIADAANQPKYTAEAKFLRAYAYFNLVRLYGEVPLVTEVVLSDDKEALFTRVSVEQVYAQIVSDLQEAVSVLDNGSKSRASRAAAQALLAKVYMTQPDRNYVGAQQLCDAIISSGRFSLMSDYNDVFYSELNDEIIFAVQYVTGNAQESQGFSAEFTSTFRQGGDDGQNIVNDNLIADFTALGGDRTNVSYFTFPTRTEVTKFLPDGSDFSVFPPTYGNNARDAGNDYIAIRYADVLLMRVEASIGTGTSTSDLGALMAFQEVRDRAFPDTAPNSVSSVSKTELLAERRVELAFENQRFFDLLRFGVAETVLSAHAIEMGYIFTARSLLLPIPASEINLSGGLLTQNPGY